jgi:hypothetical protein
VKLIYSQKILILLILLFIFESRSHAFIYRYFSDPIEFCDSKKEFKNEQDQSKALDICHDLKAVLPLSKNSLTSFVSQLDDQFISDYQDLLFAKKKSALISTEAMDQVRNFERLKNKMKKEDSIESNPELKRLNDNAQVLASINYKIEVLSHPMPGCFVTDSKECERLKDEYIEKNITPLVERRSEHLLQNPILAQSSAQNFLTEMVEKRLAIHQESTSENFNCIQNEKISTLFSKDKKSKCLDPERLKKEKLDDISFEFTAADRQIYLLPSLESGIKSATTLSETHRKIEQKISQLLNDGKSDKTSTKSPQFFKDLHELRTNIFHDRNLTTDYFVTMNEEELGQNQQGSNRVACHLIKEQDANNKNALINSVLLDAATLLIPMGGPFLLTKVISTANKLNKLSKLQNAKVLVVAETTSASLSTGNIAREHQHCNDINKRMIQLGNVPIQVKDEYLECRKTLNDLTMSYSLAILGGATGIAPSLKLMKSATDKENKIKKLITGISDQDFMTSDNQEVLRKARDLAIKHKIELTREQERAILASHKVSSDGHGITELETYKNGEKVAGKDSFTFGEHKLKQEILEESGLPKEFRHELHRSGITGVVDATVAAEVNGILAQKLNEDFFGGKTITYFDEQTGKETSGNIYKRENGSLIVFSFGENGKLMPKELNLKEVKSVKVESSSRQFIDKIRENRKSDPSLAKRPEAFLKDDKNYYASKIQEEFQSSFTTKINDKDVTIDMIFDEQGNYSFVKSDSGEFLSLTPEHLKNAKYGNGKTLAETLAEKELAKKQLAQGQNQQIQELAEEKRKTDYLLQLNREDEEKRLAGLKLKQADELKKEQMAIAKKNEEAALAQKALAEKKQLFEENARQYIKSQEMPMNENQLKAFTFANNFLPKTNSNIIPSVTNKELDGINKMLATLDSPTGIQWYNNLPLDQKKFVDDVRTKGEHLNKLIGDKKEASITNIWALNKDIVAEDVTKMIYTNSGRTPKVVTESTATPRQTHIARQIGISIDESTQIKFSPKYTAKDASLAFKGQLGDKSPNFENLHTMLHFEPGSQVAERFLPDAYQFVKGPIDQSSKQVAHSIETGEVEKIRQFYRERIIHYLDAVDPTKQRFPR